MIKLETLKKLEGLQMKEDIAKILNVKKSTTNNIITKLKKQGHLSVYFKKSPRMYKITTTIQRPGQKGMYDWINKYSDKKIREPFDHQVHGQYGPEEALVESVDTGSIRILLNSLKLFNHIKDWSKLYNLSKKNNSWRKIGALYDVARKYYKVRRFPKKYLKSFNNYEWLKMTDLNQRNNFPEIQNKWKVYIPFNEHDIKEQY